MRVLLVEDDVAVSSFVRRGLVRQGFAVDESFDGRDAYQRAIDERYDVIVLDILIPYIDGFEFLYRLRGQGNRVPVLILSAKDRVGDRVRGLDCGADDYLVKPFSLAELTARIRALLRRHPEFEQALLQVGDLEIDLAARKVQRAGMRINLTAKEFSLLQYFARNRGTVLTRAMIAEHVWDQHFDNFSNTIDVYVRYLRAKIDDAFPVKLIHTIRGVGYVMSTEPQ